MDSVSSVRVEREEGGMNKNFTTLTRRMRGLGLRLRRLLGDCDIAVETGAQECGIMCGKNAMEQFGTALSATRRFTMWVDHIAFPKQPCSKS